MIARVSAMLACVAILLPLSAVGEVTFGYNIKANKGLRSTGGHGVVITLHLASTSSWLYDPATGGLNQLPTPEENANPTTGIGIVVKKNPGSSEYRLVANADGATGRCRLQWIPATTTS